MAKKLLSYFFIFLFLSSCSNKEETTYRIVGKNGKAIYLEKKVPVSNKKYVKSNPEKNNINENSNNLNDKNKMVTINNNISEDSNNIVDSSAYTLSSVMDETIQYNSDNMNSSAQNITNKSKHKIITDFDHIPKSFFALDEKKIASANNIKKKQNIVNNDVSKIQKNKNNSKLTTINETQLTAFIDSKLYYIQLGFFVSKDRAIKLKNDFSDIKNIKIIESKNNNGDSIYKVIVGGFKNRKDADNIVKMIKNRGHEDVYIFQK